jgi:protein TonB
LGWVFALVCSVLLNVSLFGLMPRLTQRVPDSPCALEEISQVQVIRIKRTAPPPKKKPEKPRQVKPAKTKVHPKSRDIKSSLKPILKPQLAFQLNPKLPSAPMDLVMPGLEHFSMDFPILKAHYTMGELDSPLTPLVKIPPIYPMVATRRGIEGYVTVEFLVTKKGLVQQIRIVDSRPEHVFDKSVTNCVSQWKFKPGTIEGIPVATLAQTTIRFKLEKQ